MKKTKLAIIGFGHIAKKFHFPIWLNKKLITDIFLVDKEKFSFQKFERKSFYQ